MVMVMMHIKRLFITCLPVGPIMAEFINIQFNTIRQMTVASLCLCVLTNIAVLK